MAQITGTIQIDFETESDITKEQFDKFKKTMQNYIDNFDSMVAEAATEAGFESASFVNAYIHEDIECDETSEKEEELDLTEEE